jgi:hypothetical protein
MVAQEQDSGLRKGPLEMGIADLGACSAQAFPGGCLGTFDQTAVGDNILYRGKTVDVMDFIAQHEAEDLADAGHGLQQIQGVGDIAQQLLVIADERRSTSILSCPAGSAKRSATPSRLAL